MVKINVARATLLLFQNHGYDKMVAQANSFSFSYRLIILRSDKPYSDIAHHYRMSHAPKTPSQMIIYLIDSPCLGYQRVRFWSNLS